MSKQSEIKEFQKGDRVKWKSSGTVKHGEVIEIVPKFKCPKSIFSTKNMYESGFRFDYGGGESRNHTTYLIAIDSPPRATTRKMYWPKVFWLLKDKK